MALLYLYALNRKEYLGLNRVEILKTKGELAHWSVAAFTGLFSALFAYIMPLQLAVFAAFAYSTMGISMPLLAIYFGKKIEKATQKE